MGKTSRIANTSDLAEGAMKKYQMQDTGILLARIGGKYYATQDKCPHFGGDLSKGKLEGSVVTCPRHGSQFDLTDGSVRRWLKGTGLISSIGKALKSPHKLISYAVKIEGKDIMVEL